MAKSSDGLVKVAPGKWRARITIRVDGKRKDTDRIIEADTKLEAMQKRDKLRADFTGEVKIGGKEWTIAEALEAYLASPMPHSTRMGRKTQLGRFAEVFGGERLSAIRGQDVQRWLAGLAVQDKTATVYRSAVNALYAFARLEGRTAAANPQTQKRVSKLTPQQELAALEAEEIPKAILGDDLRDVFYALEVDHPSVYPIIRLQYLIGARVCEVLPLEWRDLDWDTGVIRIIRNQSRDMSLGPPKKKKKRHPALGPNAIAFMRGHKAAMERLGWPGHETLIFPRDPETWFSWRQPPTNRWPYEVVLNRVKQAIEAAGVTVAAVTHAFRHAHASRMEAATLDEQSRAADMEGMGHSPKVREIYTAESVRRLRGVARAPKNEEILAGGVFGGASE